MISRKKLLTSLLVTAMLGAAACSGGSSATSTPAFIPTVDPVANPTATPTPDILIADDGGIQFTVNVAANGSQQAGTAIFTQRGDVVNLKVNVSPSVPLQMMSLRSGTCPGPGVFVRDLDPLIGGASTQDIRNYGIGKLITGNLMLIISTQPASVEPIAGCADLPKIDQSTIAAAAK